MKQCFLCGRKTNGAGGVEYYEHSLGDICAVCDMIRNQFAAAALTGLLAGQQPGEEWVAPFEETASKAAFLVADAMMKARKGDQ